MDSKVRVSIASVVNTEGFQYIDQLAEKLISAQADIAIEEEDEKKGEIERRRAQAQRAFWVNLKRLLQASIAGEYDPDAENFNVVSTELA
jgi:hypothetical protein